jgi:meso-butanediol dehydrogenase/(S,S)-butanediol dehydrogenase/diacetyl reductase
MGRLSGKSVIVTGAASGIGRATAERLAQEGAAVVIADIDPAGEQVAEGLRAAGGSAIFVKADVSQEADAERLAASALQRFGKIDGLVNNAGIRASGRVHEISLADWQKSLGVNLTSAYLCSRFVLPDMLKRRQGSIVNLSSVSGVAGDYGMAAYNAAKGGVTNLTRAMALDYARDGIRVNAVCPGSILTPMLEGAAREIGYEEGMRRFNEAYPPGHIGEPLDIANLILFLLSDEAKFVNGANVLADGGITAHTGQPRFGSD